ncbi:hypothetical protein AAA799P11_01129 [Marine Group I thaumarchaeote SCGC AAA799-P11]|uniref:Uncharacterized protein n=1 Tax=Marine Group I thaumarchaeote SCGC AAA799-P11 TaxID=1502295 RepID=A0A087RY00_9ARCH|nr:hypothetical protein AAA799P11_01129 [Marine Group I thaumarchaeote SCGC AAA799-P11]
MTFVCKNPNGICPGKENPQENNTSMIITRDVKYVKCMLTNLIEDAPVAIPLDNAYLQPVLENLFEEYQKGLADLSIDDNTRILEENKKLIVEKYELQKQTDEMGELKNRLEEQL